MKIKMPVSELKKVLEKSGYSTKLKYINKNNTHKNKMTRNIIRLHPYNNIIIKQIQVK